MTTIKVRRDTAANWVDENPVLAPGEPGLDLDNRVLKVGDGTTAWDDLQGIDVDGGGGDVVSVNGRDGVVTGLAEQADLTAEATLARNASNLTSGTVADARIPSTIARDSEIAAAYQPLAAVLSNTTASFTTADETKLDHLTVTQAVDLDTIEARVNSLDTAVVLRGGWDASAGTFPGGGTAQAGDSYIVTTGGTVNGVVFTANDRLLAIVDNASTGTYAANWLKLDYTDQVLSVDGRTGAVTLTDLYQPLAAVLTATTASFTTADETKLDGLSALADGTEDGQLLVWDDVAGDWVPTTPTPSPPASGVATDSLIHGGSSLTLAANDATWNNFPTIGTIAVPAVAGDVIEVSASWRFATESVSVFTDICTEVAGAVVNSIASRAAAPGDASTTGLGIGGLFGEFGLASSVGASLLYTVQAGDLSGGNVTLRLRYRNSASLAAQKVISSTTLALFFGVKNFG